MKKMFKKVICLSICVMFIGVTFNCGSNIEKAAALSSDKSAVNEYKEGLIPDSWNEIEAKMNDPENQKHINKIIAENTTKSVPSSVDLSTSNYFPCIRNQDNFWSCASFATTYYQFTYHVARLKNYNAKTDTTKQFSPKWTYNYLNQGNYANGTTLSDTYEILIKQGAAKWSEFTYDGSDEAKNTPSAYREWCTNNSVIRNALNVRAMYQNYLSVPATNGNSPVITSYNDSDLDMVKLMLSAGEVLVISTTNRFDVKTTTTYGKVAVKNVTGGAHAMTVVGYNDNVCYDLNGDGTIQDYEKGAFKVANSWGDDWENSGYIWVMYDALNTISNVSSYNVSNRRGAFAFDNSNVNTFAYIEVKNYENLVTAEVELRAKTRNKISLFTSQSYSSTALGTFKETFLNSHLGGPYAFSGAAPQFENATFIFDYDISNVNNGTLTLQNPTKYFYLKGQTDGTENMYIRSAKLVDDAGNVIANNVNNVPVSSPVYITSVNLGSVTLADVDYNGVINSSDVSLLNSYIVGNTNLSNLQIKLGDVNFDNTVDIADIAIINTMIS